MPSKSLQQRKQNNTIPELVKAVEDSFVELDRHTHNKVFLTHQQCLEQIILCDGGNNYKLPHMGKERLLRQGQLTVEIYRSIWWATSQDLAVATATTRSTWSTRRATTRSTW
jgi:hypothetical protein